MRLTIFTDLSFRILIMANSRQGELFNIDQATEAFKVSRAHLMKVVNTLTREGYLKAVRGRHGGLQLNMDAKEIRLGDVLGLTESDFALADCMRPQCGCTLDSVCKLKKPLNEALRLFIEHLNTYTLEDISLERNLFEQMVGNA